MFFIESLNSDQTKIFSTFGVVILYHLFYIILLRFFAKSENKNGTHIYSTKSFVVKVYKVFLSIRIVSWNIIGIGFATIIFPKLSTILFENNKIDDWIIFVWIIAFILLLVFLFTLYGLNQEYFSKDLKFITKKTSNTLIVSENSVKINTQEEINLEKYCLYFKNNKELNSFKTHLEELGLHLFRFDLSKVLLKKMDNTHVAKESLGWYIVKVIIKGFFTALMFSWVALMF